MFAISGVCTIESRLYNFVGKQKQKENMFVHSCIYHFFSNFLYILENIVNILTGRKFDKSFLSEVPLSISKIGKLTGGLYL